METGGKCLRCAHERPVDEWPPNIGDKVHYNSGSPITSWSGEVVAVVDDDKSAAAMIRFWQRRKRFYGHRVEIRWWWDQGEIRKGPLPKELVA